MTTALHPDALAVVFGFVGVDCLEVCAKTCRAWRGPALQERRVRARRLCALAFRWVAANPGRLVLAGSMAMWIEAGEPTHWFPGDADLFWVSGTSHGTPAAMGMFTPYTEESVSCGVDTVSFLSGGRLPASHLAALGHPRPLVKNITTHDGHLQLVLASCFVTPKDVLDAFDISCCMVGYTAPGQRITGASYSSPRFASFHWRGGGDDDIKRYQNARTDERARKYMARGYTHARCEGATAHQMRFAALYIMDECATYQCLFDGDEPPVKCI